MSAERKPVDVLNRVNRERRAAELAERDRVLCEADTNLAKMMRALQRIVVAAQGGRLSDVIGIALGTWTVGLETRRSMRVYYDKGDEDGK